LPHFLVQPQPPASAFGLKILDLHLQRRVDAREGIGEGGDQRPVAPVPQRLGRNGVDQRAPLLRIKHGGLAGFHDMLRSAHGGSWVYRHNLTGDQPVEHHPHRRELLLYIRRRMGQATCLYIGGDVVRADCRQRQAAFIALPGTDVIIRKMVGPRVGTAPL
jgi:hypothetical protein